MSYKLLAADVIYDLNFLAVFIYRGYKGKYLTKSAWSSCRVQKLMGENIKVVWAKFSTLSWAVFGMHVIAWHTHACPHLELKTQPRFCLVSLRLFII